MTATDTKFLGSTGVATANSVNTGSQPDWEIAVFYTFPKPTLHPPINMSGSCKSFNHQMLSSELRVAFEFYVDFAPVLHLLRVAPVSAKLHWQIHVNLRFWKKMNS